jgi:hypothetical protein
LLELNILAVLVDPVFDPVLDIERIVGVSRIVRGDWHDPCVQQEVVPVEDVVGAVYPASRWCLCINNPLPEWGKKPPRIREVSRCAFRRQQQVASDTTCYTLTQYNCQEIIYTGNRCA